MKIEIIDKLKLILAENNEVLTEFNSEIDDIIDYTSFKKMITNINYDTSQIRVITEEEDKYFNQLKLEEDEKRR